MAEIQHSRRRNQIVAERNAEKVRREREWLDWNDDRLEQAVFKALETNFNTQKALGHLDRSADAVVALEAMHELRFRGRQLTIFP